MTQPLTAHEAGTVLSPHLDALRAILRQGWARWRALVEHDTELAVVISNRTRAAVVYDFVRHEALAAFFDTPGVTVSEDRQFLLLTFSGKVIVRFKKFRDGKLRTSGASTTQAREYANQVLPGLEELTHLVAGYLPGEAGIDLETVAITCSMGSDLLWFIDLDLGIEDEGQLGAPAPTTLPGGDQGDTIVRPRRSDDTDEQSGRQSGREG